MQSSSVHPIDPGAPFALVEPHWIAHLRHAHALAHDGTHADAPDDAQPTTDRRRKRTSSSPSTSAQPATKRTRTEAGHDGKDGRKPPGPRGHQLRPGYGPLCRHSFILLLNPSTKLARRLDDLLGATSKRDLEESLELEVEAGSGALKLYLDEKLAVSIPPPAQLKNIDDGQGTAIDLSWIRHATTLTSYTLFKDGPTETELVWTAALLRHGPEHVPAVEITLHVRGSIASFVRDPTGAAHYRDRTALIDAIFAAHEAPKSSPARVAEDEDVDALPATEPSIMTSTEPTDVAHFYAVMKPAPANRADIVQRSLSEDELRRRRKGKGRADAFESGQELPHLEPDGLLPALYPFQSRSVHWLLRCEGKRAKVRDDDVEVQDLDKDELDALKRGALWQRVSLGVEEGDETLWINPIQARASWQDPVTLVEPDDVATKSETGTESDDEMDEDEQESALKIKQEWTGKGMICDEMGMGKTLAVLSLVLLNRDPERSRLPAYYDRQLQTEVKPSGKLTLIVCPAAIFSQWVSEIGKHAPHLRILLYESTKRIDEKWDAEYIDKNYDIVVTTFDTLRRELNIAKKPHQRSLRKLKGRPERINYRRSLLVSINWFRVCMDEVQMVASTSAAASQTAALLPRKHSIAVSGTPIKSQISDLTGLLKFLRVPLEGSLAFKKLLEPRMRSIFAELFQSFTCRTLKSLVGHELQLPKQQRFIVPVEFTAVEELHYQNRYLEALNDLGLNAHGEPPATTWRPDPVKMRHWLLVLRQMCCHAQAVGDHNRRALGAGGIKTLEQVLALTLEKANGELHNLLRSQCRSMAHRAHLIMYDKENCVRFEDALEVCATARAKLEIAIKEVESEIKKLAQERKVLKAKEAEDSAEPSEAGEADDFNPFAFSAEIQDEDEANSAQVDSTEVKVITKRLGVQSNSLREFYLIFHSVVFFSGNAYFGMGKFAEQERTAYDEAEQIRKRMLALETKAVETAGKDLVKKLEAESAVGLVDMMIEEAEVAPGIHSADVFDRIDAAVKELNTMAETLWDWRQQLFGLLLTPVSKVDEADADGEEYAQHAEQQEKIDIYIEVFGTLLNDWRYGISGNRIAPSFGNSSVRQSLLRKMTVEPAGFSKTGRAQRTTQMKKKKGQKNVKIVPEKDLTMGERLLQDLSEVRDKIVSEDAKPVRSLIRELQDILDRAIPKEEAALIGIVKTHIQKQLSQRTSILDKLTGELNGVVRRLYAARVLYYKQLQGFSDEVADLDLFDPRFRGVLAEISECRRQENVLQAQIRQKGVNKRYVESLATKDARGEGEEQTCVICTETFTDGILTSCQHIFCETDFQRWMIVQKTCPICKKSLQGPKSWQKVKNVKAAAFANPTAASSTDKGTPRGSKSTGRLNDEMEADPMDASRTPLREIPYSLLRDIHAVPTLGGKLSSKVSLLISHILLLRSRDADAKCIVFSAWNEALKVVTHGLIQQGINFIRLEGGGTSRKEAASKFANDPTITVFILHSESQSAGLNLIAAKTVFLVEPLLHPSLELQAVGRTHRIGQTSETTVYQYFIRNSVDQRVAELAARHGRSLFLRDVEEGSVEKQTTNFVEDVSTSSPGKKRASNVEEDVNDEDDLASTLFDRRQLQTLQRCLLGEYKPAQGEGNDDIFAGLNDTERRRILAGTAAEMRMAAEAMMEEA